MPSIEIRPVIFKGTQDTHHWAVLQKRWDDFPAQLHGDVVTPTLAKDTCLSAEKVNAFNRAAPNF